MSIYEGPAQLVHQKLWTGNEGDLPAILRAVAQWIEETNYLVVDISTETGNSEHTAVTVYYII